MRIRHNDITASIDSSFDEDKIADLFKEYAAGIKPKRVVTFDILEKCRKDIRRLVLIGIDPAEIAKGFAPRGLRVSAATMKLFIDLRIKRKRKRPEPDTSSGTPSVPPKGSSGSTASPDEEKKPSNVVHM